MKRLVMIIKSIHADNNTLTTMFAGYLILLFVAGSYMSKGSGSSSLQSVTPARQGNSQYVHNMQAN